MNQKSGNHIKKLKPEIEIKRLKEKKHEIDETKDKYNFRIMVCEDHTAMRETIVRLIRKVSKEKKLFVDVKESINGLECLYAIYHGFISGCKYDAVLLDETMPFMNGSKCINLLMNMYQDGYINKIKRVSISSFDNEEIVKIIRLQGCEEFLPKPICEEVMSNFIDNLIMSI